MDKSETRKRIVCAVLLLSVVLCVSADVEPQEALTSLSSSINSKLLNLKSEIGSMQSELTSTIALYEQASKDLQLSESERQTLEMKSTALSASLQSINEQLMDSTKHIERYKARLSIFYIAALVIILCKVAAFILYIFKIPTPRWLDILL